RYDDGAFDATLKLEYNWARDGTLPVVNLAVPGMLFYVPPGRPVVDHRTYSDAPDINDANQYSGTLTVHWDTGIGNITSITNYTDFDALTWTDYDGSPLPGLGGPRLTTHWQFSSELRNDVQLTDSLRLLVGGLVLSEHYDIYQDLLQEVQVPGGRTETLQDQDHKSLSAFGQFFWDVFDGLQFQAGLRFTHDNIRAYGRSRRYINPDSPAQHLVGELQPGAFEASGEESWDQLGWKIVANYAIDDDRLIYVYRARGFKQGGFNGRIATPEAIGPFGPEHVDTWEAGIKADWFDRRLRTNFAVFHNRYDDMQVAQRAFVGATAVSLILNAAQASSRGFEAEVQAMPVRGLTLGATVGYLDA